MTPAARRHPRPGRLLPLLALTLLLLAAAACHDARAPFGLTEPEPPAPADSAGSAPAAPYDFGPQLLDPTPRAAAIAGGDDDSPRLLLGVPGVLAMTDASGAPLAGAEGPSLRFIDLSTGADVALAYTGVAPDSTLTGARLAIRSVEQPLLLARLEHTDPATGLRYHHLLTADSLRMAVVAIP